MVIENQSRNVRLELLSRSVLSFFCENYYRMLSIVKLRRNYHRVSQYIVMIIIFHTLISFDRIFVFTCRYGIGRLCL